MSSKYTEQRQQFSQAVDRLAEALAVEETSMSRDSAIQRFEFTLDLAWETLKTHLEAAKGVRCASPKDCFRAAFRVGVLDHDALWVDLVDLRNLTVHTYREELAKRVYAQLPQALVRFRALLTRLPEA